jgi:hypothetical protein
MQAQTTLLKIICMTKEAGSATAAGPGPALSINSRTGAGQALEPALRGAKSAAPEGG